MKHWNYEHIENVKHIEDYLLPLHHGYQQWLDHHNKLWYRGNFVMDNEFGYHDQFLELGNSRHMVTFVTFYIR